jgi:hypothetical protein
MQPYKWEHDFCVLEAVAYQAQVTTSDLAGIDPKVHDNSLKKRFNVFVISSNGKVAKTYRAQSTSKNAFLTSQQIYRRQP